jgi:hypothetical protein
MNLKQSLNYWLNSRQGFYDPVVINRLQKNQTAFNNYIIQCERDYQSAMQDSMTEDAHRIKSLNGEMKNFLRVELWPMILRTAKNDLEVAKELIRRDPYAALVREYDLADDINEQYLRCKLQTQS